MSEYIYETVEIPVRFWMFPLPHSTRHKEVLREMGAAGWELVSSTEVGINNLIEKLVLTFKKSGSK